MKKSISLILAFAVFCCAFSGYTLSVSAADRTGTVAVSDSLNVRSGAGTSYSKVGSLGPGDTVIIEGETKDSNNEIWFKITCGTVKGYVHSKYITVNESEPEYKPDADFEAYLKKEGFPESYKPYLRNLHAKHPNWVFDANKITPTWREALEGESVLGRNLVHKSYSAAWKSMEPGAYDSAKGEWIEFDSGGWVAASPMAVAYYLDPRNSLDETSIFQFLSHSYSEGKQTVGGLKSMVTGTFLANKFPENTHETYSHAIFDAGKASKVNPYVLASMILVEQGNKGTGKSISGTVKGYEGYYNYFNIRAYKYGSYDAVQYGLLYAMGTSKKYNRPWNTHYKSILGGSLFYANNFVNLGQNSLYYKKFNVVNKSSGYYKNQYMTNIVGADTEASRLAKAYKDILNDALVFNIPVYTGMPKDASPKPGTTGSSDNFLKSLSVSGYSITPSFVITEQNYELIVPHNVTSITVNATARDNNAKITGAGKISLTSSKQTVTISVKSTSGEIRKYTILVAKAADTSIKYGDPSGDGKISITDLAVTKKHILGKSILTGNKFKAADANKDGKVTISDLALIKKHILGKAEIK